MNSIFVIHPYKQDGVWVFDDSSVGLCREPFVAGADQIIDRAVGNIPNAYSGFTLFFSGTPFPGFDIELEWRRGESGGNWYYVREFDMEGWLCPALLNYFESPPEQIYAQFRVKGR